MPSQPVSQYFPSVLFFKNVTNNSALVNVHRLKPIFYFNAVTSERKKTFYWLVQTWLGLLDIFQNVKVKIQGKKKEVPIQTQ